jgi:hypothetical protein
MAVERESITRIGSLLIIGAISLTNTVYQLNDPMAYTYLPYQWYPWHALTGEEGDGRERTEQLYSEFNSMKD